jgi:hypothetical protein
MPKGTQTAANESADAPNPTKRKRKPTDKARAAKDHISEQDTSDAEERPKRTFDELVQAPCLFESET